MLKSLILATAASLALVAAPASGAGGEGGVTVEAAAALAPNQFIWVDQASAEPISLVISTTDQRAYVYRGQTLVAVSTVSTGKDGKETPAGTYPILQKKQAHRSNLYNNASMPFMQRLTWDGIAIHAGRNPGFPDSHGCIRVPTAFAKRLFAATDLGTTVTVTDESIDPEAAPPPTMQAVETGIVARANATQLIASQN